MGCMDGISSTAFPPQSEYVGRLCVVLFHYGADGKEWGGTVLRDDLAAPYETIIRLCDGRVVRGVECQWSPFFDSESPAKRRTK